MKGRNTRITTIERAIHNAGGRLLWASQVEGVSSRIYAYQIGKSIVLMQTFIQDSQESSYILYAPLPGNLIADDVEYIDGLTNSIRSKEEQAANLAKDQIDYLDSWSEEHEDHI